MSNAALFALVLHAIWWFVSGGIAFGMVQPDGFMGMIGFLILWLIIRHVGILVGAYLVGRFAPVDGGK